jgi:hypothetical protein
MRTHSKQSTKQSHKETADAKFEECDWEVISDDEQANIMISVDAEKELKQINSLDDRTSNNSQKEILPQSRHTSNNSNQINSMTSEVLILQTLRNLDKYPTRTKLCRVINQSMTPQVYEQGFDVIQASLCLQLQTLPGIMELIDVKQTINNVLKGVSVKTTREEFIESLEIKLAAYVDKLKKEERDGLERLARTNPNNTFEEIWMRINEIIHQKESLCDENWRLKTENKSQKDETDSLKNIMDDLKKLDLEESMKDQEFAEMLINKQVGQNSKTRSENVIPESPGIKSNSTECPSPMQEISSNSPVKRSSDPDKKRVYNYSWKQHIQLQKSISLKLQITRTLSSGEKK